MACPKTILPGIAVSAALAAASIFITTHYGGPTLLYALLLGMALHFLYAKERYKAGIDWTGKHILHIGVALLGARIGVDTFLELGWMPIALVIFGVASTIGVGLFMAKALKLPNTMGMITGGATAICGASAALAISSLLPKKPEVEKQTLFAIIVVTTISTICMILYPLLAKALTSSGKEAGILIGATIHDVAQVIGAGYLISPEAGDTATVVKLLRVAMLVPVCLMIAMMWKQEDNAAKQSYLTLPWFLVVFVVLAILNSMHVIPADLARTLAEPSRWCLITAIAAIGMKTSLGELQDFGFKPIALVMSETLWLLGLVLLVLSVL